MRSFLELLLVFAVTVQIASALTCNAGGPYTGECVNHQVRIALSSSQSTGVSSVQWSVPESSGASLANPHARNTIMSLSPPQCNTQFEVILTVTDSSGASADCLAVVHIQDVTPPTLIGLYVQDATVECDDVPTAVTVSAVDNCDTSTSVTLSETKDATSDVDCSTTCASIAAPNNKCSQDITSPISFNGSHDWHMERVDYTETSRKLLLTGEFSSGPTSEKFAFTFELSGKVSESATNYPPNPAYLGLDSDCYGARKDPNYDHWTYFTSLTGAIHDVTTGAEISLGIGGHFPQMGEGANALNKNTGLLVPFTIGGAIGGQFSGDGYFSFDLNACSGQESSICSNSYLLVREWSSTDSCGNTITKSQRITVQDTVAPSLSGLNSDSLIVECDQVPKASDCIVEAFDNCDTLVDVAFSETSSSGQCQDNYQLTRTWTATDSSGNTEVQAQTVNVRDTTPPKLIGIPTQDLIIGCLAVPQVPNVIATDNCDDDVDVSYSETSDCSNDYRSNCEMTRKWRATDNCGNIAEGEYKVILNDQDAPSLIGVPEDAVVEADEVPEMCDINVHDFCDDNVIVTKTEERVDGTCTDSYTLYRTWEATDANNNNVKETQTLTVIDTKPPVLVGVPSQDYAAECDNIPSISVTATDTADNTVQVVESESYNYLSDHDNDFIITKTWTATDNCGNTASASHSVTVTDTTPPTLTGVGTDAQVECSSVPEASDVAIHDNCDCDSNELTLEFDEVVRSQSCEHSYTLERHWKGTDCSGNIVEATQVIQVSDTSAPAFDSLPGDYVAQSYAVGDAPAVHAHDDCDGDVAVGLTEVEVSRTTANDYVFQRVWKTTDTCGNTNEHIQTITVIDDEDPVFSNVPSDLTVECDSVPEPADIIVTDAGDNNVQVEFSEEIVHETSCDHAYVLERKWIATDLSGNTATFIQTLTIQDTTAPTLANTPPSAKVSVEAGQVPDAPEVMAIDNCDEEVNDFLEFTETRKNGKTDQDYDLTRTWLAFDACGNKAEYEQAITVRDTTSPEFRDLPDDITVECSAIPEAPELTVIDEDRHIDIELKIQNKVFTCPTSYTFTRRWKAKDDSGNKAFAYQNVNVVDTQPPVITFAHDALGHTDGTYECDAVPDEPDATANDACDDKATVSLAEQVVITGDGENYQLIRTWTATDRCGNVATHVATLNVQDTTAPLFKKLPEEGASSTEECDATTQAPNVKAYDNCDTSVEVVFTETTSHQTCDHSWVRTRVWETTDSAGNVASFTQITHIQDSEAPTFHHGEWREDRSVKCQNKKSEEEYSTISTKDNCDKDHVVHFATEVVEQNSPDDYVEKQTWTAVDSCGNAASHSRLLTVYDPHKPTYDFKPQSVTVECDNVPELEHAIASDLCDENPTVTVHQEIEGDEWEGPNQYNAIYTWTATDASGNVNVRQTTVRVRDRVKPDFLNAPDDYTIEAGDTPSSVIIEATDNCDADHQITIVFEEDIVNKDSEADNHYHIRRVWTATDQAGNRRRHVQRIWVRDTTPPTLTSNGNAQITAECHLVPDEPIVVAHDEDPTVEVKVKISAHSYTCGESYTLTRRYWGKDSSGNKGTWTQTVTVVDTTPPVISGVPLDATYSCDNVPDAETNILVTDNCDETATVSLEESFAHKTATGSYILHRTWTAVDSCGNAASETQVITVRDTDAPVLYNVGADESVSYEDLTAPAEVTATDNCDYQPVVSGPNEFKQPGACDHEFTLTYMWSATDDAGNEVSATQIITVYDDEAPIFNTLPEDAEHQVTEIPTAPTLTAVDNSDGDVSVTFSEKKTSMKNSNEYVLVRTWTAIDACGNKAEHSQNLNIIDTIPPTIEGVPADVKVECDEIPDANAATTKIREATGDDATISLAEAIEPGKCANTYTIVRVWTATDGADNTDSDSQTIKVVDKTKPSFVNVPPTSLSTSCDSVLDAEHVVATDNCDEDVTVTLSEKFKKQNDKTPFDYIIKRTWTAEDACGNSISTRQVVDVTDSESPTFNDYLPQDTTASCDSIPETPIITASDNCDIETAVDYVEHQENFDCEYQYELSRRWSTTDTSGNTASHTQTVYVKDEIKPSFEFTPDHIVEECDSVSDAPKLTASHPCDPSVTVSLVESSTQHDSNDVEYIVHRTWTATDLCGNSASYTQEVQVTDTTDPVIEYAAAVTEYSCEQLAHGFADIVDDIYASGSFTDNCGHNGIQVSTPLRVNEVCQDTYDIHIALSLTDYAGHQVSDSLTISVRDDTAPVLSGVPQSNDLELTVECDAIPAPSQVTATDACDPTVEVVYTATKSGQLSASQYTETRVWSATDRCGNHVSTTQVIHVVDTEAPSLENTPGKQSTKLECDELSSPEEVTASDNCDNDLDVVFLEQVQEGECDDSYILVRTWSVTDSAGHTASFTQTITVVDTTDPEMFNLPTDKVVTADCASVPEAPTDVSVVDNCDDNAHLSFQEVRVEKSNSYNLRRTWTASDDCGNTETFTQIVKVRDTTDPVLSYMPENVVVQCDDIPDDAHLVTASDDCGLDEVGVVYSEKIKDRNCANEYKWVRKWTVSDASGNSVTHKQIVQVVDNSAPSVIITQDGHVLGNGDTTIVNCDEVPDVDTAIISVSDNCQEDGFDIRFKERKDTYPTYYTIERQWTIKDDCSEKLVFTHTYKVVDLSEPELVGVPDDVTIECDDPVPSYVVTASDNCAANMKVQFDKTTAHEKCNGNFYTLTRHWSVTDDFGLSSFATQVVTVQDTTPPVLTNLPAASSTVECHQVSDPTKIKVNVDDNCEKNKHLDVFLTTERDESNSNHEYEYILRHTWASTDSCGNVGSFTQTVSVQDSIAPLMYGVPASSITVEAGEIPATPEVTAADECDPEPQVHFVETINKGECDGSYTITRRWTATDAAGNENIKTSTIHVRDTTAPVLSAHPGDSAYECDSVPDAHEIVANDNSGEHIQVVFTETKSAGADSGHYTLHRTWTASDSCNNVVTHVQNLQISDQTPPALFGDPNSIWDLGQLPQSGFVEEGHVPPSYGNDGQVTAVDNCDANPTLDFVEEIAAGTCPSSYTITRSWTATDVSGNQASHVQVLQVTDSTPPTLHGVPAHTTAEVGHIPVAPEVTVTDNGDNGINMETLDVSFTEDHQEHEDGSYTIVRTWRAVDGCGNWIAKSQRIFVQDTTAPVFNEYPRHETVECDSIPDACVITATDNGIVTTLYATEERIDGTSGSYGSYILRRTWAITDSHGNYASHVQDITVIDSTAPVLSRQPQDEQVGCDCDVFPAAAHLIAFDNCDGQLSVDFHETISGDQSLSDNYQVLRHWSATDSAGNTVDWTQTITVTDAVAPTFSSYPTDKWTSCDAVPDKASISVSDNCDSNMVIKFDESDTHSGICEQSYSLTRTWEASDKSGNTVSHSQTIQVEDTAAPTTSGETVTCIWPPNKKWVEIPSAAGSIFQVKDNCAPQVYVSILSCNSSDPSYTNAGQAGVGSGFDEEACYYDAGSDTLYVKAERDGQSTSWTAPSTTGQFFNGRTYSLYAQLADECGNKALVSHTFWVPHDAVSYANLGMECIRPTVNK